ncbi:RING1 and YY1-binding protein [Egretta garzetta]|uniref:RING1 and YY1-binding protein n=1 Tax=Egretta garzetta TaxID=188379 RepID=UPI00051F091A|nr:RING1 and YY1-binding protein [Egretta garzetta]
MGDARPLGDAQPSREASRRWSDTGLIRAAGCIAPPGAFAVRGRGGTSGTGPAAPTSAGSGPRVRRLAARPGVQAHLFQCEDMWVDNGVDTTCAGKLHVLQSQEQESPTRPKRQAKPAADEGFWDCSVCTFRNSAEAFKCSICDVRKGTSTRKPRINSQLVAQQVAQQYATPPPPKKEKKEKVEKQDKEKPDKEKEISPSVTKKNTNKKTKPKSDIVKDPPSEANSIQSGNTTTKTSDSNHTSRPRLKNVDRSTAQQLAVTVGNVTVIITDFKEKTRSSSTSSSTVTSSAGSEQQNQSSSGSESTDKGSSRSSTPKGDMSAVNDESF